MVFLQVTGDISQPFANTISTSSLLEPCLKPSFCYSNEYINQWVCDTVYSTTHTWKVLLPTCQSRPLLNTSSVQLSYSANKPVSRGKQHKKKYDYPSQSDTLFCKSFAHWWVSNEWALRVRNSYKTMHRIAIGCHILLRCLTLLMSFLGT